MQLVAQHRRPHRQLQYGVGDPERGLVSAVINQFFCQPGAPRLTELLRLDFSYA